MDAVRAEKRKNNWEKDADGEACEREARRQVGMLLERAGCVSLYGTQTELTRPSLSRVPEGVSLYCPIMLTAMTTTGYSHYDIPDFFPFSLPSNTPSPASLQKSVKFKGKVCLELESVL